MMECGDLSPLWEFAMENDPTIPKRGPVTTLRKSEGSTAWYLVVAVAVGRLVTRVIGVVLARVVVAGVAGGGGGDALLQPLDLEAILFLFLARFHDASSKWDYGKVTQLDRALRGTGRRLLVVARVGGGYFVGVALARSMRRVARGELPGREVGI